MLVGFAMQSGLLAKLAHFRTLAVAASLVAFSAFAWFATSCRDKVSACICVCVCVGWGCVYRCVCMYLSLCGKW